MHIKISFILCLCAISAAAQTIDHRWRITTGSDIIEQTAAQELKKGIQARHNISLPINNDQKASASPSIYIGTITTNPAIAAENRREAFQLDTSEPESYHMVSRNGSLWIAGASPKGAMNGVFRFLEKNTPGITALNEARSPAFHLRVGGHICNQWPPSFWSQEDQAAYYSSHYINVIWGEKWAPPLPCDVRRKYGLGVMMEVRFPPEKGPWMDSAGNASAVYINPKNNNKRGISPFDPKGREAYAKRYREALKENPDVRVLYGTFADYNVIPSEPFVNIKTGEPYGHSRADGIKEILGIMKEVIGARDIRPAVWLWHAFFGDAGGEKAFMLEMAQKGISVIFNEAGNNDCWLICRDNFVPAAVQTDDRGNTIYGDNYMPLVSVAGACESTNPVIGMSLPAVAAYKLTRLSDIGAKNFIIWWAGVEGWTYQPNAEVIAQMIWEPRAFDINNPAPLDPVSGEPLLKQIAARDFGPGLAPRVMDFWQAFDRAIVSGQNTYGKNIAPDEGGLHIMDWYQRLGIFTEFTAFGGPYHLPLIPSVLSQRKEVQNPKAWMHKPGVEENYKAVLASLDTAIGKINTLCKTDAPPDVARRLNDMRRWADMYRRILTTQYNFNRAATAMLNAAPAPDDRQLRQTLAPIIGDEIKNDMQTIELLKDFYPEMNLTYNGGEVWGQHDPRRRDAEIQIQKTKIEAMRGWLTQPQGPNLALKKNARGSSKESDALAAGNAVDGDEKTRWGSQYSDDQWFEVDLGKVHEISRVNIGWLRAYAKTYEVRVATNGKNWESVYQTDDGKEGRAAISLPAGTQARQVRIVMKKRGSMWGYSISEIEVY
ncbi:MAG: discoidin domain-containing protein [Opitutaceae bacterium]|jgi:hypothetical protein|nr:discoidin domain-containing protein [Opitutaceae bacterium]